jgi:hypothetical protein
MLLSRQQNVGKIRDIKIATGYGLDDREGWILSPRKGEEFSLIHRIQTVSGARPASYPMDCGGSVPGGKAAWA